MRSTLLKNIGHYFWYNTGITSFSNPHHVSNHHHVGPFTYSINKLIVQINLPISSSEEIAGFIINSFKYLHFAILYRSL